MNPAEVDRFKVIDTDTHIIEPYDLWTSRLSVDKWGDRVPHVAFDEKFQEDAWFFGSDRVGPAASAAQAGWHQYPPDHPPSLDVVDQATWDPRARLQRMDEYGIWAQVLYPNVAGFGAGKVLAIGDPELMLACVRAYNDFLADYASVDPRRFVPIMALPMWDVDLCRQEVERATGLGHKGVIMTGEPTFWGLPKIADPHWDPSVGAASGRRPVRQLPHRLRRHVDLRPRLRRRPGATPTMRVSACSSAWATPK